MDNLMDAINQLVGSVPWLKLSFGIFVFILGKALIQFIQYLMSFIFKPVASRQRQFVVQKIITYGLNIFLILLVFKIVGVDFKVILGAAGVLTVAIGFAARTSISNLICGIFLIFERPFVVGDIIEVDHLIGEVLSINLLSMNIRTLDNLMVRVPNEMVLSKQVINYSFFPIRRFELALMIPYGEDLNNIHQLLSKAAAHSEMALNEPKPIFRVEGFQENHIDIIFEVWSTTEDFYDFRDIFSKEVHRSFKKSGIEQPHANIEIQQHNKTTELRP